MHSPIHLKDLRILRVQFDTRQVEEPGKELEFSHALEIHHPNEAGGSWLVRLDVQFKPSSEVENAPYLGEVVVVGMFDLQRGIHGPILLPTLDARCFIPKRSEKGDENGVEALGIY